VAYTNSNRERKEIVPEIREQVAKMQEAGVIKLDPEARNYSQVLLTPKPDRTWRFCIDFRKLNLCLKGMMWPIPSNESIWSGGWEKRDLSTSRSSICRRVIGRS